jgi:uncharacterized membrane protein YphA (DoxX/SURF4 family)
MNEIQETIIGILMVVGLFTIIALTVFGLMNMLDGFIFNATRKDYCATKFDNKLEIKNCSIKPVYKFMTEYLK